MTEPAPSPELGPPPTRRGRAKRWALIGLLMGAIGLGLLALGHRERARINWLPFQAPAQLVPGATIRGQFRTDAAEAYWVEVSFPDRSRLAGVGAPQELEAWRAWVGKRLALRVTLTPASGAATDLVLANCEGHAVGAGQISCIAGHLQAAAGQTYTLAAVVTQAATELREVEAQLEVTLGAAGRNQHLGRVAVYLLPGLVALVIAVGMGVVSVVAYFRERRARQSHTAT